MNALFIKNQVLTALDKCAPVNLADQATMLRNQVILWQIIRASEALLELAVTYSVGDLQRYFAEHWAEERDHAVWLAEDLQSVNIDVHAMPLMLEAVELVGSMLYLTQFVSPCCLLGYMLMLECFPKSLEEVSRLEEIYGKALLRTLRYHSEHDPEHGAEVLAQIDKLSDREKSLVLEGGQRAAYYFVRVTRLIRG